MATEVLGIDVGGVIIDKVNTGADTAFFAGSSLEAPAVAGAFEAIRRLVAERFGADAVFIVSTCGPELELQTLEWFRYHDFFGVTGMLPENLRFCRTRQDKAGICEELGVTHFIDDRLEVLHHLTKVATLFLFAPRLNEGSEYEGVHRRARLVNGWDEILAELLPLT